ncbi:uncharacterized protein LOC144542128 [Centroberyx gerrardi]
MKQLNAKVEENSQAQTLIQVLQKKLDQKEAQCSDIQQKHESLQKDLDDKMKELEAKSDSVTSLALQISTLTLQLEALNRQKLSTDAETKIKGVISDHFGDIFHY